MFKIVSLLRGLLIENRKCFAPLAVALVTLVAKKRALTANGGQPYVKRYVIACFCLYISSARHSRVSFRTSDATSLRHSLANIV
jgi:hypothetical protein